MYSPDFSISHEILKNISLIEAAREVIADAPLLPLWEKRFKEDALVRTAHHGTHVEGNSLNIHEAREIISGAQVLGRPRDIQEVINYRAVMDLLKDEQERGVERITEALIKKIHKIVVTNILEDEKVGEYRLNQVVIKDSSTGDVTHKPPSPIEVPLLMRDFVYWINTQTSEKIHTVLKAGLVHHEFVRIHPFVDGNGRVGRAMATLVLLLGKYDIRNFFSLEEYYDKDPLNYYHHLAKANDGDLTAWLEYFTLGVAIEFDRIKKDVLRLSKDSALKEKLGGRQIFISERQRQVIEWIQQYGYLQNQQFSSILPDVSEDTVVLDLKPLIEAGIIKKIGKTKGARYEMG